MALTTRCLHCGTAFKVVPDQLKIRDGLVRCGACASVFDGRATLVAEIPTLQADPQVDVPAPSCAGLASSAAPMHTDSTQSSVDVFRTRACGAPAATVAQRTEPRLASGVSPRAPSGSSKPTAVPEVLRGRHHALRRTGSVLHGDEETEDDLQNAANALAEAEDEPDPPAQIAYPSACHASAGHEPNAVPGESRMRYVDDYYTGRMPPEFLDVGRAQQRARWSRLWGWACVAAAVALVGLSAYVYRVQWATQVPALRPLLQWMCAPLQCTVGYERRIERISILSSSLRPLPGGALVPGQQDLVLTAVLRNRFNAPQHWPALALELKDFSDTVMVRKTLLPHDYLPADMLTQPFGPNVERKIVLPLRVHDVQVNGYQLDRFFP